NDGPGQGRYHRLMRLVFFLPCAFASTSVIAACGSDVAVSSSGQGGSSSTAAVAPNTSGTGAAPVASGPGAGTTTTGTGIGGGAACDALCSKAVQLGCEAGDCISECSKAVLQQGDCTDEFVGVLSCMTQHATSCADFKDPPPGCGDAMTAYLGCSN